MSWLRKISHAGSQALKKYLGDEDLDSHRQLLQSMVFMISRFVKEDDLLAQQKDFRYFLFQELNLNEQSISIVETWLKDFWQSSGGLALAMDFYKRSTRREKQHDRFLFSFLERFSPFGDEEVDMAKFEFCRNFSIQTNLFKDSLGLLEEFSFSLNDSEDELRRKYKAHVLEHHPDKGGDSEQFARLKDCFDFLLLRQRVLY